MKKRYLICTLILGSILCYYLTIFFLPNAIYAAVSYRLKENQKVETNALIYPSLPNEEARTVVMANPDFLYVACYYDISKEPLRLTGTLPDSTYWSVAFYQPNTINWYIKNDMEYGTNELDLILAHKSQTIETTAEIARSPVEKGFCLIRILVTDTSPERLAQYEAWQKSVRLNSLNQ